MIPTLVRRVEDQRRSGGRHLRLQAVALAMTLTVMLLGTALIAAAESPLSRPFPVSPATTGALISEPPPAAASLSADDAASPSLARLLGAGAPSAVSDGRPGRTRPSIAPRPGLPKAVAVPVPRTRLRARGDATWYCVPGVSLCQRNHAGGMYAAAGAALRVGDWRGRVVTVCQGRDCIRVTLVDWCACGGGRVIDLYGDAFRRLAPLSSGVLRVSVRW